MSTETSARLTGTVSGSCVRLQIRVRGAVQGVGFRPFIYHRAQALGLTGWVANSPQGVVVEAEGDPGCVAELLRTIIETPPENASVAAIETAGIETRGSVGFAIHMSESHGAGSAEILPDLAVCDECLRELFDPLDRRYRYPFINCTRCGPRYSIIEGIPYDRVRTSMRDFPMCPTCQGEYEDPRDRRFHAEPNACAACGPRLVLRDAAGKTLAEEDAALAQAEAALRDGQIVAIKGIGGFQLMADARDDDAIRRLRSAKRRPAKPFAVMFPSLGQLRDTCRASEDEATLLISSVSPIVLLRWTGGPVATAVASGSPCLGAFLPYTPLHHLLMRDLGFPVVATSGNRCDEPIVTDENEALVRLEGVADLFLCHNRRIVRPVDDSVARIALGRELVLRRARGYAPAQIAVERVAQGILAFGGHLKTTIALTTPGGVVLSQHLGDLGAADARRAYTAALTDSVRLHGVTPRRAVRDLHPDYASTLAAEASGIPVIAVPHHLAHIVSCMAENGVDPPALGIAWDGAGYGTDGTIWGGEFLRISDRNWQRVAHLRAFPLPGGDAAAREPRRAALGLLYTAFGDRALMMTETPPVRSFSPAERGAMRTMLAQGINAPLTTSAGRFFEAFAALAGLCQRTSYEGQAAAALEWAAEGQIPASTYPFPLREAADGASVIVDWQPALEAGLADLAAGSGTGTVSAALHAGLAAAITAVATRIGERRVVLSGGCFQNIRLLEAAVEALRAGGFEAIWHRRVPPNDGGLALGQAVWAGWTEHREDRPCA